MAQYLTYYEGLYRWRGPYDLRHVPRAAGFRWNPDERQWQTESPQKALKLREHCDAAAAEELERWRGKQKRDLELSRATDADIRVPVPPGLNYFGYQKAGVAYMAAREGVLLGDEMGLGKTVQAIGVMNYLGRDCRSALIICPSSLKINWLRELERWLVLPLSAAIADGSGWPSSDIVIVNYDLLGRYERETRSRVWDVLVCDEAHYIKNPKAKRTLQVVGQKRWDPDSRSWIVELPPIQAKKRILMTGTPIFNKPQDLWTLVDYAMLHVPAWQRFDHFRSKTRFLQRYMGYHESRYGWEFDGPQNLDELHEQLRRTVMIRRLKSQVLTELPPKIRQVVELDSSGYEHVIRAEYEQARRQQAMVDAQAEVELAKAGGDEKAYREAVRKLKAAQQVAFSEMSRVRHEVGRATAEAGLEHILNAVENTGKLVLFGHHRDVLEYLKAKLEAEGWRCVLLYGGMSADEKQKSVDLFQRDPNVHVFLGSLTAAGTGITLTAANHVVFVELDWVPSSIDQAEDRCHRISQDKPVLVQHLVLAGSLTSKIAKAVVEKQETNERVLDGKGRGTDAEPGYLDEPITPAALADKTPSVSASLTPRERLEAEAESMPPETTRLLHRMVRWLASRCDGARTEDSMGFNRLDSALGRKLAALPDGAFTARHAALAKTVLRKYRKQLCEGLGREAYESVYGPLAEPRDEVEEIYQSRLL